MMDVSSSQKSKSDSEGAGPIRRASVIHHEPSQHGEKPKKGSLKVRRQSQSLRQEYRTESSLKESEHGSSVHSASEHGSSMNSRVAFDKVDVLEFPETVGMYVIPTSGPPVALSMDEVGHSIESVDQHQAANEHKQHRRFLKMSTAERERKLREQGVSCEEVQAVVKEAAEIRNSRKNSAHEPESDLKQRMADSKRKLKEKKKKGGLVGRLNPFRR